MSEKGGSAGHGRAADDAQQHTHDSDPDTSTSQHAASGARGERSDISLFGIVAHELRSPIAAILGYEELIAEGLLGDVDERALEALARIRSSARQLLTLTEGLSELSGRTGATPEAERLRAQAALTQAEDVDHTGLLRAALERAASEAASRRVTMDLSQVPEHELGGRSDPQTVEHILDAVLGAALKSATGRTLTPALATDGANVVYRILGTGMDPAMLDAERIDSGIALRMRIASGMATRMGGSVRLVVREDGTGVEIVVPATIA